MTGTTLIFPTVRTNPEYRFDEVMSGYNYNFIAIELTNSITTIRQAANMIHNQNIYAKFILKSSL